MTTTVEDCPVRRPRVRDPGERRAAVGDDRGVPRRTGSPVASGSSTSTTAPRARCSSGWPTTASPVAGPLRDGPLRSSSPERTRAALSSPDEVARRDAAPQIDSAARRRAIRRCGSPGACSLGAAASRRGRPCRRVRHGGPGPRRRRPRAAGARAVHLRPVAASRGRRGGRCARCTSTELVAPAIYDDGLLRITAAGPGAARLAGEVDHSNRPHVSASCWRRPSTRRCARTRRPDRHHPRPVLAALPRRRGRGQPRARRRGVPQHPPPGAHRRAAAGAARARPLRGAVRRPARRARPQRSAPDRSPPGRAEGPAVRIDLP